MAGLTMALLCAVSHRANAAEIKVLASGRFRAAYLQLVPGFERVSGHKVVSTWGGSMGSAPTTIPNRMQRQRRVHDGLVRAHGYSRHHESQE
ncbi:MAG TPA: hypothetical protein VK663_09440 [Burkholderiales bacterium]|nr:hypothetical protein [Burkholderiales bacterium]